MADLSPEVALQLGLETTVNDSVLVRRGARLGVLVRPVPWAGLGRWASGYPHLGRLDWTATTRQLIDKNLDVAPNLSRVVARADLGFECSPLRTSQDGVGTALRLLATAGASYTVDDLTYVAVGNAPDEVGEWS